MAGFSGSCSCSPVEVEESVGSVPEDSSQGSSEQWATSSSTRVELVVVSSPFCGGI